MSELGSAALGSAVSGGFGIIGSLVNYGLQKRLAAQQNEYNLQMWNLNNEYNSPLNQMKRYEEAGLNPSLLYGQISSGNASKAAEMMTPSAPDLSPSMRELGEAFNIEGLKTMIAKRKEAQQQARAAAAAADDVASNNEALELLSRHFKLDPNTGQLVQTEDFSGNAIAKGKVLKMLENNFRTNSLLFPRAQLIGSQRSLNRMREELYAPQIRFWNFNTVPWRMNTSFWLGNARTGAQILSPFLP